MFNWMETEMVLYWMTSWKIERFPTKFYTFLNIAEFRFNVCIPWFRPCNKDFLGPEEHYIFVWQWFLCIQEVFVFVFPCSFPLCLCPMTLQKGRRSEYHKQIERWRNRVSEAWKSDWVQMCQIKSNVICHMLHKQQVKCWLMDPSQQYRENILTPTLKPNPNPYLWTRPNNTERTS
jgi:hypothetical protein